MKTLADVRRRAIAGTRLEVIAQTKRPVLVGTVRTIANPRSLSARTYEFTSDHAPGETYVGTWPKAGETRIIDADTFEYDLHPGPGVIRLRFLQSRPVRVTELSGPARDDRPRGTYDKPESLRKDRQ